MFEKLTEGIGRVIDYITGQTRITEYNIATTVKELRRALIAADVHYRVAKEFTDKVKQKALEASVVKGVTPGQMFIKITYEELVALLGDSWKGINLKGKPAVILLVGLQGSGKTTFAVKLGYYLRKKRGRAPLLVAADVYRPAAIDQIKQLASQENIPVYEEGTAANPVEVAANSINYARLHGFDAVIIDTAGRQVIDEEMMEEAARIKERVSPSEVLLVVDAMMGQESVNVASQFASKVGITGVALTKMDGDARGGAALSIKYATGVPIVFLSTGERIFQIEEFHPERLASRILGMGDVISFVEKAEELELTKKMQEFHKKAKKKKFTMDDFLKQLRMYEDVDRIKEVMSALPGMAGKIPENIDVRQIKRMVAIILSMTPQERENPSIINFSRKQRIARGSGTSIDDVNRVLKFYEFMYNVWRNIDSPGFAFNLMRYFGL